MDLVDHYASHDKVCRIECLDEQGNITRVILTVAVEQNDIVTSRYLHSKIERSGLAIVLEQLEKSRFGPFQEFVPNGRRSVICAAVVVPFYNECSNAAPLIREIRSVTATWSGPYEVILIDDRKSKRSAESICFEHAFSFKTDL